MSGDGRARAAAGALSRAAAGVALEWRVEVRHGVPVAALALAVVWSAVLVAVPAVWAPTAAVYLLIVDTAGFGVLFAVVLVLFERTEGARAALAVAPLRPAEYVGAKLAVLTALAVALAAPLTLAAARERPALGAAALPPVLLGVALLSLLLVGVVLAACGGAGGLEVLFTRLPLVAPLVAAPVAHVSGALEHPLLYLVPTTAAAELIRTGLLPEEAPGAVTPAGAVLYLLAWTAVAVALACRAAGPESARPMRVGGRTRGQGADGVEGGPRADAAGGARTVSASAEARSGVREAGPTSLPGGSGAAGAARPPSRVSAAGPSGEAAPESEEPTPSTREAGDGSPAAAVSAVGPDQPPSGSTVPGASAAGRSGSAEISARVPEAGGGRPADLVSGTEAAPRRGRRGPPGPAAAARRRGGTWSGLVRIDLRGTWRDPMLTAMLLGPAALAVVLRWAFPPVRGFLAERYGLDLDPAGPMLLAALVVLHVPLMIGAIGALRTLADADDGTLALLRVSPPGLNRYLAYRLAGSAAVSAAGLAAAVPLSGLAAETPADRLPALAAALALAALQAPLLVLAATAFAASRVGALVLIKTAGAAFTLLPAALWWLPPWAQWFFAPIPLFWPVASLPGYAAAPWPAALAAGTAVTVLAGTRLLRRTGQRLEGGG